MTKMVNMMIEAYISVIGAEKWNSLTVEQQHDAIMIMVNDTMKALDK